jgi:hypothetical protein
MPGNRRSVDNPEGAGSAAGDSTVRIAPAEPQRATQGLQFAGFTPIQPLPSIKQVTAQTQVVVQQVQQPQQQPPTIEEQNVAPQQPTPDAVETQNVAPSSPETVTVETQNPASLQPETGSTELQPEETFEACWQKMVDFIFQKKPAFYHQLRDYLPRYEDDVIYVDVENDFQKNQLEMSKRAMLEYWRNQFKLNVNEIEFVIHEHEKKKVIYTSEDKVNNMLEQNPELKDFLQVLNFRIKD